MGTINVGVKYGSVQDILSQLKREGKGKGRQASPETLAIRAQCEKLDMGEAEGFYYQTTPNQTKEDDDKELKEMKSRIAGIAKAQNTVLRTLALTSGKTRGLWVWKEADTRPPVKHRNGNSSKA